MHCPPGRTDVHIRTGERTGVSVTKEVYLSALLVLFILAFALRNIRTFLSTRRPIRGRSSRLTLSILLSTIIYLWILLRLTLFDTPLLYEFELPPFLETTGMVLVTLGFVLGLLALAAMKDSWRVGIRYDQKTRLVTGGIFRVSRNPYFLSHDILIFGYLLIFTSPVLIALYVMLVAVFHRMILEEEKYLEAVHGEAYAEYRKTSARYLRLPFRRCGFRSSR